MQRITRAHLDAKCETLARMLGRPTAEYTKTGNGYVPNVGAITLEWHFGGAYTVNEMVSESGAINHMSPHCTAREIQMWLDGAITALYRREKA